MQTRAESRDARDNVSEMTHNKHKYKFLRDIVRFCSPYGHQLCSQSLLRYQLALVNNLVTYIFKLK